MYSLTLFGGDMLDFYHHIGDKFCDLIRPKPKRSEFFSTLPQQWLESVEINEIIY